MSLYHKSRFLFRKHFKLLRKRQKYIMSLLVVKKINKKIKIRRTVKVYVCLWSDNAVRYYTCTGAHFEMKCKILLHEINTSLLNTIGAGDSTGIERSSPLCNWFFSYKELTKTESTAGTYTIRAILAITAIYHAFLTDFHKKNNTNILRSFEQLHIYFSL